MTITAKLPIKRPYQLNEKEMERDYGHENAIDGHYYSNSANNFLNPFVPNAPFLYPLKTSQNLTVFYKFRGQRKGALETNGLNLVHFSAGIYLFKVNNGNTKTVYEFWFLYC